MQLDHYSLLYNSADIIEGRMKDTVSSPCDVSSLYTDLGECAWSCEHCAAMFWYGERLKGYSKTSVVGYAEAERLSKYFERQGTDRDVCDHSMDLSMQVPEDYSIVFGNQGRHEYL
ncbi:hypothetical protein Tco_0889702 [Tanacetum coccineum]